MWDVAAVNGAGAKLHIASFDDKLLAELAADRIRMISTYVIIVEEGE